MSLLPVIERELRAEARHSSNVALRIISALAAISGFQFLIWDYSGNSALLGTGLFALFHYVMLVVLWVIGPALTADCISRERRDGTLGLLFLTPLRPSEIVVGKVLVQMTRLWSMWLAAVPVLTIPFVLGGVSWLQVATALGFQIASAMLAISSGLVASSFASQSTRAYLVAWLLSGSCFFALSLNLPVGLFPFNLAPGPPRPIPGPWTTGIWTTPTAAQIWQMLTGLLLCCFATLFISLRVAGWRVKRSWRDEPLSARAEKLRKVWFEPRFWTSFFRARMKNRLERNPIAWLQEYSTTARLSKWGWCIAAIFLGLYGFSIDALSAYWEKQRWVMCALMLGIAFTAANSFHKERQSGALELLLVAPLSAGQIIAGRVLGIWRTYLPSTLFLLGIWIAGTVIIQGFLAIQNVGLFLPMVEEIDLKAIGFLLLSFLTLPIIGLAFSLSMRHFVAAWLSAFSLGVLAPLVLPRFFSEIFGWLELYLRLNYRVVFPDFLTQSKSMFWSILTQLVVAGCCAAWLYGSIAGRKILLRPLTS